MEILKYTTEYENELKRKFFRDKSIKNYVGCVNQFLKHFDGKKKEPKAINEDDIKLYLRQFKEQNTQRSQHSAIKCFYKYVLNQPNKFRYIEYAKRNRKLPIVHSQEEIQKLISACDNNKHKTIICLMYACGLRVGEVIKLKITDIDSSRMVINILDAKGGKDRQVMLPENLLKLLRDYYKEYKPNIYLFNGQFELQYSERSIAQLLKKYSEKASLNKRIYPHLLRHDSFTHLVESGCDIALVQKIAGHQNIKTTNLYLHLSHTTISKINSPLNNIVL
jgi:site-specific recombinase XerD